MGFVAKVLMNSLATEERCKVLQKSNEIGENCVWGEGFTSMAHPWLPLNRSLPAMFVKNSHLLLEQMGSVSINPKTSFLLCT